MSHPFSYAPVAVMTGDRTLTAAEVNATHIWSFDPGAARNLVLPAASACPGIVLFISNRADAAEVITIQDPTGPTTVCTPTQAEAAIVWSDGVLWDGIATASS